MFYSNTIFKNVGMSSQTITGLVGGVNFLATLGGMAFLTFWGRKTIMFWMSILIAIVLVAIGNLSLHDHNTSVVVLILVFISLFEFSSGPITWLYMSEIMQDKGLTIATCLNWLGGLAVSALIPGLIDTIGEENIGYIFITVGGCTVLSVLFIAVFMKETKGKSP